MMLLLFADGYVVNGYRSSMVKGEGATHWMPLPLRPHAGVNLMANCQRCIEFEATLAQQGREETTEARKGE